MKLRYLLILPLLGCVPRSHLKTSYDAGVKQGRQDGVRWCGQYTTDLRAQLKTSIERLAAFGWIDGSNFPQKSTWKGDTDPNGWDGPDGTESWMK